MYGCRNVSRGVGGSGFLYSQISLINLINDIDLPSSENFKQFESARTANRAQRKMYLWI